MGLTERRIGLLFAIFLALLVVAAGRTLWLGGVQAASLQRAAVTQQVDRIDVPARRGAISDRNGIELAVAEPAADVAATPYLVEHPAKTAAALAPLLGRTQAEVLEKLGTDGGFVYLARNLPAGKAEKIKKLKIPGMSFIPSSRRDYPRKWLASQAIGGVGVDGQGLSGLEYTFEKVLGGTDGTRRIVKDALGEPIVLQETKRAVPGKDIKLTIDAQLQGKVEDVLAQVGAKWSPKGATAVVMDPATSAILALADWPRVDANELAARRRTRRSTRRCASSTSRDRRSSPSRSPARSRTRSSRPRSSGTCRRRSRWPTGSSRRRIRAGPSTSPPRRSSRSPRTSGP